MFWGGRDMWFRYDDSNPLNFAWRWQQWELAFPCPLEARGEWAAFSPHGNAQPFSGKQADGKLRELMLAIMSAAEAARHSWHAARVTIATRLFARRGNGIARDEIEGVIQALVRWKTPEAMRLYARMEPGTYADYVELGTSVGDGPEPEGISDELPEIDPEGIMAEHEENLGVLERSATEASQRARAERRHTANSGETSGAAPKRRKAAPATGAPDPSAAPQPVAMPTFELSDGVAAQHMGDESWGVIGQHISLHNSFWGEAGNEYSRCSVVGYIGKFEFDSGPTSRHTYVIEYEGNHYPIRHTAVANALVDAALKRHVRKAAPPKVLRA